MQWRIGHPSVLLYGCILRITSSEGLICIWTPPAWSSSCLQMSWDTTVLCRQQARWSVKVTLYCNKFIWLWMIWIICVNQIDGMVQESAHWRNCSLALSHREMRVIEHVCLNFVILFLVCQHQNQVHNPFLISIRPVLPVATAEKKIFALRNYINPWLHGSKELPIEQWDAGIRRNILSGCVSSPSSWLMFLKSTRCRSVWGNHGEQHLIATNWCHEHF